MNHLLKGAVTLAGILIVLLVIHVLCNTHDIHLDSTMTGVVSAVCAMLIYSGWIKNEKK